MSAGLLTLYPPTNNIRLFNPPPEEPLLEEPEDPFVIGRGGGRNVKKKNKTRKDKIKKFKTKKRKTRKTRKN